MGATYALIPAAGHGARFRDAASSRTQVSGSLSFGKLFALLAGKPVLYHTLHAFDRHDEIAGIIVVGSPDEFHPLQKWIGEQGFQKTLLTCKGGATRQESVRRGLSALPPDAEIVAIHDAARPLVTSDVISRTIHAAWEHGASGACLPVTDTIRRVDGERSLETLPRPELRAAQTPQTFRVSLIRQAHERAVRDDIQATDDAALVERLGKPVVCVEGDRHNLKITTPDDLTFAEALLRHEQADDPSLSVPTVAPTSILPRIGFGYDIHRLAAGRRLVLGGIEISHDKGLDGHSDADVLLHALMDALLGAAGLPDIGHLFPNTDEQWRGVSSRVLLREVARQIRKAGFMPVNVDVTLIAERPKIAPHVSAMRGAISEDTGLPGSAIGIKATTNEGVGSIGREEAIAAHAVALVILRC